MTKDIDVGGEANTADEKMTKAEYLANQERVFELVEKRDALEDQIEKLEEQVSVVNDELRSIFDEVSTYHFRRPKDGIVRIPLFVEEAVEAK